MGAEMTKQTIKARNYLKIYIPNLKEIQSEEEEIEWDRVLSPYTLEQLQSIMYWVTKEKDFMRYPLLTIDRIGKEYIQYQIDHYNQEQSNEELNNLFTDYTEEQKRKIKEKCERTKLAILRGN